jgi:hypothetical protein
MKTFQNLFFLSVLATDPGYRRLAKEKASRCLSSSHAGAVGLPGLLGIDDRYVGRYQDVTLLDDRSLQVCKIQFKLNKYRYKNTCKLL